MLEYLLVLIVIVGIIMALDKAMKKPLRDFLQTSVLDTIQCMMQMGQYPYGAYKLCTSESVNFVFDPSGSGPGGSGSTNNSGSNNSSANQNNQGDDDNSNSDSSDSSQQANKDPSFQKSGSSDKSALDSGGGSGSSGFGFGSDNNVKEISLNEDGSGEGTGSKNFKAKFDNQDNELSQSYSSNTTQQQVGGKFFVLDDKKKKTQANANVSATTRTEKAPKELNEEDPKTRSFIIPEEKSRNVSSINIEQPGFSFMGFIKWAIIIAILVIFLILLGSQLNSIRKGWTGGN